MSDKLLPAGVGQIVTLHGREGTFLVAAIDFDLCLFWVVPSDMKAWDDRREGPFRPEDIEERK